MLYVPGSFVCALPGSVCCAIKRERDGFKNREKGRKNDTGFFSGCAVKKRIFILSFSAFISLSGCQILERGAGDGLDDAFPTSMLSEAQGDAEENPAISPDTPASDKPAENYNTINTQNIGFSDAIGIAIARHPDIGRATAVVIQSNAQIAVEKSAWYPTLQYGVSPGYSQYYGNSRNTGSRSTVQGTVGANQLVYDFGRTSSRIGVARATYEKDRFILKNVVENVAYNMAMIFIELTASQELIRAAEREYDAMRRTREKIAQRVEGGLSDAVDLNQADVAIQRARADLLSAQTRYDIAAGRFAEIVGIRPGKVVSLEDTTKFIESLGPGRNSVDSTPSVLAADANVKASLEKVRLARAQRYPSVNLSISQQKATSLRNATNDSTFVGLQLGGSFNTGFREQYQVEAAQAELNAAKLSSENERLVTRTMLGSAETEARGATVRMDNSRQMMSLSLTSRDLYWQQYTFNKRPLTDVVNAERDTFIAESDHIAAMADYMSAVVKSYSAVGDLVERIRARQ